MNLSLKVFFSKCEAVDLSTLAKEILKGKSNFNHNGYLPDSILPFLQNMEVSCFSLFFQRIEVGIYGIGVNKLGFHFCM